MRYRSLIVLVGLLAIPLPACGQESAPDAVARATPEAGVELLLRADEATTGSIRRPEYPEDNRAAARLAMVRSQIQARGVHDEATLAAMRRVPRHLFVRERDQDVAYNDYPIPIGHSQTISQPYIVGVMTELLELGPGDRVLEVGTGSGYQAAIAAEIAREVVTIEIVGDLARLAADRLKKLGYGNITVLHGDGYFGWEEGAPYDGIIVTAAADHVPPPLVAQLKPGGRMAIPVGRAGWAQNLLLVEKQADGRVTTRNLLPVQFVPLTRDRR